VVARKVNIGTQVIASAGANLQVHHAANPPEGAVRIMTGIQIPVRVFIQVLQLLRRLPLNQVDVVNHPVDAKQVKIGMNTVAPVNRKSPVIPPQQAVEKIAIGILTIVLVATAVMLL